MKWADEVRIETPEQIDVELEVAGLGSRYMAQVIDWAIKIAVILTLVLLGAFITALLDFRVENRTTQMLLVALFVALGYLFVLGFDIYFEVRRDGQTPGKMVAGIRVIREGGAALDFGSACVRNLVGLADFLPFGYLLGALVMMLNQKGQRVGDMAAGTLVIRERALAPPGQGVEVAGKLATEEITFTSQQLAACDPVDRHILKAFFQRYLTMDVGARDRLAAKLASEYWRRTSYEADPARSLAPRPAAFLASLYRDLEADARHAR
jgi:uncharacterized RDD family membrane protein YckC